MTRDAQEERRKGGRGKTFSRDFSIRECHGVNFNNPAWAEIRAGEQEEEAKKAAKEAEEEEED